MTGIYKITSPSGKIYIGQSVDIVRRWSLYKTGHCIKQKKLHASLLKYGYDNHSFEVLETCEEKDLNDLEIAYIAAYGTFNTANGLNLDSGGAAGRRSEETKAKISKSKTGNFSDLQRSLLVARNKAGAGKKLSPERIEQIRIASTGRFLSDEAKERMSIKAKERIKAGHFTDEIKNKMSVSAQNKVLSEDHKAKLHAWAKSGNSRKIKVIDTSTGVIYPSGVEVAKVFKLKYHNLKHKLNGRLNNDTPFKKLAS